jgi:regulator of replication initiation timing
MRMRAEIERLRAENIFLRAENDRLQGQLDEHATRAGSEVKPHGAREITAGTGEGPLRRTPRRHFR